MKKILSFVLAAVALVFTACSNDETIETSGNGQNNKGMVLVATVSQQDSRAAIDANETFGTWKFTFDDKDNVVVGNNTISDYYTFTKSGETFSSTDAKVTSTDADWYAYYPATTIDLTNQEGTSASAAKLYALAGKTAEATTGSTPPLQISMDAKAAVLRIVKVDNYGPCDIYLETADGKFVKGLKAKNNDASFEVVKSETKVSVFQKESTGNAGIYYVIVPAGLKISVYNSGKLIKSTKTAGLTAGKYYTLTSGPTTGTAEATINSETKTINWVQLWIGGPRIATVNVAGDMTWADARKTGDKYVWGKNWRTPSLGEVEAIVSNGLLNTEILNGTYEYNNNRHGFTLKGKQPGYTATANVLFLSGNDKSTKDYVQGKFWVSDDLVKGYGTTVNFNGADEVFYAYPFKKDNPSTKYEVRPVLSQETVLWGEENIK